ncbi:MAG: hypothetical protein PVH17_06260, partial [Anaerolineae bacterium]
HGWGTTLTTFVIKSVEVPADIDQQFLEMLAERYGKERKKLEAEAASESIMLRGKAEAQAIAVIESAKIAAREELIDLLRKTLLQGHAGPYPMHLVDRFLSAIESLSMALSTDTATATRYIEALEKMATESGTKVLIVGEERRLLPPLPEVTSGKGDTGPDKPS